MITLSPSPPFPHRHLPLLLPLPQAAVLCRPVPMAKPPRNLISWPGSFPVLPACCCACPLHVCRCVCASSPPPCLQQCLSLFLSAGLSATLSIWKFPVGSSASSHVAGVLTWSCTAASVCLNVCLSDSQFFNMPAWNSWLSVCLSVSLSLSLLLCVCFSIAVILPPFYVFLPVICLYKLGCLSICQSVFLSISTILCINCSTSHIVVRLSVCFLHCLPEVSVFLSLPVSFCSCRSLNMPVDFFYISSVCLISLILIRYFLGLTQDLSLVDIGG